jgi:hypothetical protein
MLEYDGISTSVHTMDSMVIHNSEPSVALSVNNQTVLLGSDSKVSTNKN